MYKAEIMQLFKFFGYICAASTIIACPEKVIICGVCKDTEKAVNFTIDNIESLGKRFADYAVIIYENNSSDNTSALYQKWAMHNHRVHFVSEVFKPSELCHSRTENIARARNVVLSLARDSQYDGFKYLIMADLDFFKVPWPIREILAVTELPLEWDCVCANGVNQDENILDIYSFRDARFPLGPEVMGDRSWWDKMDQIRFKMEGDDLWPVYSAFGGLAIYKRASIIQFSYSGVVTEDLRKYYRQILLSTSQKHPQVQEYLQNLGLPQDSDLSTIPVEFRVNAVWEHANDPDIQSCCEHVTLHASMSINGFGKIFINPKMKMTY
jgi:hypothetical protein